MADDLRPEQKAEVAARIGALDDQLRERDRVIAGLQEQVARARGRRRQEAETQLAAAREEHRALLQEANTLRAQIGAPLVIPSSQPIGLPQLAAAPAVPVQKRGGFLRGCLIGGAVLLGLIILGSLFLGDGENEAAGPAPTRAPVVATTPEAAGEAPASAETAEVAAAEPTQAPPRIGEDVQVGDVRWKVIEATDVGQTFTGNDFIEDLQTQGKWIRVRLEIENLSRDSLQFSGVELVDDQGRSFQASMSTNIYILVPEAERCVVLDQLNPNLPKTCQVIFEVPADAQGLRAKVGDLELLGSDEALIELGI